MLDIVVLIVRLGASGECVSREPDQGTRAWTHSVKETLTLLQLNCETVNKQNKINIQLHKADS